VYSAAVRVATVVVPTNGDLDNVDLSIAFAFAFGACFAYYYSVVYSYFNSLAVISIR